MVPNSEMSKQTKHNTAVAIPFKPGDFVHPRKGVAGIVGVVWQIRPDSLSSVEVYIYAGSNCRISQSYEPRDLEHVGTDQVPKYAVELKGRLGL